MFKILATIASRLPQYIILDALLLAWLAVIFGSGLPAKLSTTGFNDPSSESVNASKEIAQVTNINTNKSLLVLISTADIVTAPASRNEINFVINTIKAKDNIKQVITPESIHNPEMISKNKKQEYLLVTFTNVSDDAVKATTQKIQQDLKNDPHVQLGGSAIVDLEVSAITQQDLEHAELFVFPILFILLLFVFRGIIAAILPLLIGGLTIITTFLLLSLINTKLLLSVFSLNLVTGLGLGLSIDYSLLTISRFREEIINNPVQTALQNTLQTAGKTIFFSSLTVAVALASLTVFPERFLYSMGIGGFLVTLIDATFALTILPALLQVTHKWLNFGFPTRLRTRSNLASRGLWYQFANFVMANALPIVIGGTILLLFLGYPLLKIKLTSVDITVLPKNTSARVVNDTINQNFTMLKSDPIYTVFKTPGDINTVATTLNSFAKEERKITDLQTVLPPQQLDKKTWEIVAYTKSSVFSDNAQDDVKKIRSISVPNNKQVGGTTAEFVDYQAGLRNRLPLVLAIIAVTTFIILFLVTGSLILPLKALLMNILSISATFGVLVFIFQQSHFTNLLQFTSPGALDSSIPILLFAIAFGLSTDYGVFLLTRIKEAKNTLSNDEAIATGIQHTGRIITMAALLFCITIGAFATSSIIILKEMGVGTAVSVLIDATFIRMFMVPSLMKLLGNVNWWAPRPLNWVYQKVGWKE